MDTRNFANGREIPSEGYCDQPYVVKTDDGAWLCVMTTGTGHEGQPGQHVVTLRSTDCGATWEPPVDVEPADGPEASYAVLLKTPAGRVYCFYNHNTDNVREVPCGAGVTRRVDSQGYFVFKHSDDHGRSWSPRRTPIPVRAFACDRTNPTGGRIRFFWNVGPPFVLDGAACVPLHKVGRFGQGFMETSEGVFLRSENLLTEPDPERVVWETLPEGDIGLRTPPGGGPVSDEQHVATLADGSLYCTYRGTDGYALGAYSRDGGRTWETPHYAAYTPGGRRIKNPRACPALWTLPGGRFLRWFHNNSTRDYNNGANAGSRNVVWLSGGVERDGHIHWSPPEIGLYVDGQLAGASYPDLVEDGGRYYFTSTQKTEARVCPIAPELLEGLWPRDDPPVVATDGLALDRHADACAAGAAAPAPAIPPLAGAIQGQTLPRDGRGGLTLDLSLRLDDLCPGQTLLDSRSDAGAGYALRLTDRGTLRFEMCDGWNAAFWDADRGLLRPGRDHHVAVIVDGGPQVILFVVDGVVCDGGEERPLGFGRFNPTFKDITGGPTLRLAPALHGRLAWVRVYARALRVAEAIANGRAAV